MKSPFGARLGRWMPLVLTVLLGLLASAAGASLFYDGEGERLHLALDHRAEWRAKDLEAKLRMVGAPVGGFATFIAIELADGVTPTAKLFEPWAQIRGNYLEYIPRAYYWWPYLSADDGTARSTNAEPAADPGFQPPLRYAPDEAADQTNSSPLEADAQS